MKAIFYIVVIPLLLQISSNAYSQSNKGTEFWTAYMAHVNGITAVGTESASSMVLYITSDVSTTGSIDISGTPLQTFTVTANQVTIIPIPSSAFIDTQGIFQKGIHVVSVKPVAVYAHIYASSVSGATLLLPVSAMGKDYVSLNYTQRSNDNNARSSFAVIATEDNTTVEITPSARLIDGSPAGTPFQVQLQKGEVYQGLSLTDLTGTKIQSISTNAGTCKKIAVFSGSSKLGIGCSSISDGSLTSDNLFQQVYPTSTWGKNFIAAPLMARPYDIFRVVLSSPNTTVTVNGNVIGAAQFTSNLYYEFQTQNQTNVISADKPIQVVQYTASQGYTINCTTVNGDLGDPEMIYLSPIEQGLDHVTLYSTGYYKITKSFINVILPTTATPSFTLDGVTVGNFTPVPNTTYSYAQIPVTAGPHSDGSGGTYSSGTHTIKASAPFNAIAYGFGSTESYGYAAGTNLQNLNEYVDLQNPVTNTITTSTGCSNISYKPEVVLPYQTTQITWNLGNGTPPYTDPNPTPKSFVVKDGVTLYTYDYPQMVNYAAGSYAVIATVFNPNADLCGSTKDIESDITINDPMTGDFTVPPPTCLADATLFTDATVVAQGSSIKAWLWDFGDNTTSSEQNPSHTYATSGDYNVRLTITDNNGCSTVTAAKIAHVISRPVAAFTYSTIDCPGKDIIFTDNSTTAEGSITKWAWDFGDSTSVTNTTAQPFTHTFANPGTYAVTLTVTTDKGCISDVITKNLVVNVLPIVDFAMPDVCLADGIAQFTDKSTITDNTQAGFAYLWDFGDANATAANNRSTLKNASHSYNQAGVYVVTLTVTSPNGCVSSKLQNFTVNGSSPVADFRIENSCSGDPIIFDDLSSVNPGSITKVVWYFDYVNNPNDKEEYTTNTMPSDKKYSHNYTPFSDQPTKTVNVRMDVYSGISCTSSKIIPLVLNAAPLVTLTANNMPVTSTITMCQTDPAMQIVENKGVFVGAGVFSGTGVSSTGLFDPQVSGTGTFTVNYLFTAASTGCTYATSMQVTVNPTPKVTVGSEFTLLDGGQLNVNAVATVSSGTLTYKWTPSTGLSNADVLNPVFNPKDNTQYTLTVTSDQLCSAVAKVYVNVLKSPIIPNTFTPNGDGINDTWDIKYLESYPGCTVDVFNRYGVKIFTSIGYPVAWDGRYKGADVPVGTYYYVINPKNGRKVISGYLAIVR